MTIDPPTERKVPWPAGSSVVEGLPPNWDEIPSGEAATLQCRADGSVESLSLDSCHAVGVLQNIATPDEATGRDLTELLGDSDLAQHLAPHLAPDNTVKGVVAWIADSSGRRRWVVSDVTPSDHGITVTMRDVTDFMTRDLARRVQRSRDDRLYYHGLDGGVFIHDDAGRMLCTDRVRAEMLGYTSEELEALTLADLVHGYTDEGLARHWERCRDGAYESGRGIWVRKGGQLTAFTGQRSILLDYGQRALMRSTAISMEAHLKHHEILSSCLGAVLRITDQLVQSPNVHVLCGRAVKFAREAMGIERCSIYLVEDGMVGGSWGTDEYGQPVDESDISFPLDETWKSLARREELHTRRSRVEWNTDLFAHEDGKMYSCGKGWLARTPVFSGDELVAVFFNDSGSVDAPYEPARQEALEVYCSQLGSILAMKKAEEQKLALDKRLREGERLQAMGSLAGSIAHDLNNLLVPVVACPALAMKVVRDIERGTQDLDVDGLRFLIESIGSGLKDVQLLLRDALVLGSDDEEDVAADLEIGHVVQGLVRSVQFQSLMKHNPGITLSQHMSDKPMYVRGSEGRLRRILMNLTGNAVDAMEGEGYLTIAGRPVTAAEHDGHSGFWPKDADACAYIEVVDTGYGISEENITKIFEPFFSTKEHTQSSGTGLGLAIVFDMVDHFGGTVEVRSKVGKGTRFIVRLPLAGRTQAVSGTS